jgi:hypothetical protein
MREFAKGRALFAVLAVAGAVALLPTSDAQAQAGLLTGGATELPPLTLSVGKPLAEAPYELESGKYYRLAIEADGTGEIALVGPEFFRNVWIDEVIINDIEIRPLGIDSLEFDDEGTAEISFVTIRPGSFVLQIPHARGDSQRAVFNVK